MKRSISRLWVLSAAGLLAACGGGGGDNGPVQTAAAPAQATTASPAPGPTATPAGPPASAPNTTPPTPTAPADPQPTVEGTDGSDTLQSSTHPAVMAGGKGDDVYLMTDTADVVIEKAGEGVDEVRTNVSYTLPANVENTSVSSSNLLGGGNALVGNALNNRITGAAFQRLDIFGLDGDDILDGGGRYGGNLDGGNGNDTLINNIGTSRGGPGADLFVVGPRGAMTAPDVPLTILDFTPGEGDRIDGSFLGGGDPAALFASGNLIFDATNQRLVYTLNPARYPAQLSSVQQIIVLPGLRSFDPAWIVRR